MKSSWFVSKDRQLGTKSLGAVAHLATRSEINILKGFSSHIYVNIWRHEFGPHMQQTKNITNITKDNNVSFKRDNN